MPTAEPTEDPTSNQTIWVHYTMTIYSDCYQWNQTLIDLGIDEETIIKKAMGMDYYSYDFWERQPQPVILVEGVQCGSVIIQYTVISENATLVDKLVSNIYSGQNVSYNETIFTIKSNVYYTLDPTTQPTQTPTNYPTTQPTPRPTIHIDSIWEQQISIMPLADSNMAIGSYNSFIYLIGGTVHKNAVTRYDTKSDTFLFDENMLSRQIYGNTQFYAQIDSQIYMIDYEGKTLNMYSMQTETLFTSWSQIPRKVKNYACLAASSNY
eukprot:58645_1